MQLPISRSPWYSIFSAFHTTSLGTRSHWSNDAIGDTQPRNWAPFMKPSAVNPLFTYCFQPRASSFKSFRLFHLYFICISSAFHLHFICISSALWMASISSMDEERAERHVIHDSFRAMRRTLFQKRPQYTPKG